MHPLGVIGLLDLFFVGLLVGAEVAVHYGIGVPPSALTESAQIILRLAMVRRLRVLAPVLFVPSLLLATMIAVNERNAPQSWLRCVAEVAGVDANDATKASGPLGQARSFLRSR